MRKRRTEHLHIVACLNGIAVFAEIDEILNVFYTYVDPCINERHIDDASEPHASGLAEVVLPDVVIRDVVAQKIGDFLVLEVAISGDSQ